MHGISVFANGRPRLCREDLSKLNSIDAATVMGALKERYNENLVYTRNGAVLIAVNPYQELQIYNEVTRCVAHAHIIKFAEDLVEHSAPLFFSMIIITYHHQSLLGRAHHRY